MQINCIIRRVAVLFISSLLAVSIVAQSIDNITAVEKHRIKAGQSTQQQVNTLARQGQEAISEYLAISKAVDGLKLYNDLLQKQIDSQQQDINKLKYSIDNVTIINRQIIPLAMAMIESLEQFIELDVPFLTTERSTRVNRLKKTLERPDVSVSEKLHKVFEAYQIENEYGRTIESYRGQLQIGDSKQEVEFLRIGRLALLYRSIDGSRLGHWYDKKWQPLSTADYRQSVKRGLKVAARLIAPDLLTIPIRPPVQLGIEDAKGTSHEN